MIHAAREKTPRSTVLLIWLAALACTKPPGRPGTDGSTTPPPPPPVDEPQDAAPDRPDMRALSTVDARPPPPSPPPVQMVNDRACQYLKTGPFVPVVGQYNFTYSAPPITASAQAHRIQVPRGTAHVGFTPTVAGEYVIFTTAPTPVTIFSLDGMILPVKSQNTVIPECMEVKGRISFYLSAAAHVIRFGPYNVPSVDVALIAAPP
jgi:hypothetical protein